MSWEVEFFEDDDGDEPVSRFLLGLGSSKRAAAIAAIEFVLAPNGIDVCRSEYGRALGDGLYEFRVRHDEGTIRKKAGESVEESSSASVLLRLFFTVYGDHVVLLLGGYDKGDDPSARRQNREIQQARKRLRSFKLRQARQKAAKRRRA